MKKRLKSILLSEWFWLIVMLILLFSFDWIYKKRMSQDIQRCQSIVSQVQYLVDECKKIENEKISIRGKCLVWDLEKDTLCKEIQYKLPVKLREKFSSSQLTVFMILPVRKETVGQYSISKQPGYRRFWDVCVVYWPDRKPIGMHSFVSEPYQKRPVIDEPGWTFPVDEMVEWIKNLPQ
jgi:hypothetical protein